MYFPPLDYRYSDYYRERMEHSYLEFTLTNEAYLGGKYFER